jgi:hypothetical protein
MDEQEQKILHADTMSTMINAGAATVPDLARQFGRTIHEIEAFLRENEIKAPGMYSEQYRYMRKFYAAERPAEFNFLDLVYDDPEHRYINGIDIQTTRGAPEGLELIKHYNPYQPVTCPFTGEETTSVMMLDGNPSNFLVTNILPITEQAFTERFEASPVMVTGSRYTFTPEYGVRHYDVTIGIDLCGRFDRKYGALFKEEYMTALVNQWVRPYFERIDHSTILPDGFPTTPELVGLWLWRHLSTVAQLKGLARLEIVIDGIQAFITKDAYLGIIGFEVNKAIKSRRVEVASAVPDQATRPGAPAIITP